MMHPENPLLRDLSPEGKRTLLFTKLRPENNEWIKSIREQIEYIKKQNTPGYVDIYGESLGVSAGMATDPRLTIIHFDNQVTADPDSLISEKIPVWLVFNHPQNNEINKFLRRLMRRDILSDFGFYSSSRNGPIERIQWEEKKYDDKKSGRTIIYFIVQAPNDSQVFLIRTLWPSKETQSFIFSENLLIAKDRQRAVEKHEKTISSTLEVE